MQDLGSESIIWRRKENALFIDEENLAEDERMQVIKDGSVSDSFRNNVTWNSL